MADREADMLELMQRAHALGHPADYLLRAQHNRSLPQSGKQWPETLETAPLSEIEFTLPARTGQPERLVRQALHVRMLNLPDDRSGTMPVALFAFPVDFLC